MKILIVDDSRAMRRLIQHAMRLAGERGHTILEAESGMEAQGIVDRENPDLVICDWNMPGMTGLELLQALRAQGCEVDFGFVTTEVSDERKNQAREAGARFLLTKPFTPESLAAVVNG
jgi:two-component system chemotaxis response regulator CheY